MYLKSLKIQNIKCFENITIDFSQGKDIRHWTTLFGKNGLGKSTLLQAIAVVLAGPAAMRELLPVAEGWVRKGSSYGEITAELIWTEGDSVTAIAQAGKAKKKSPYSVRYIVTGNDLESLPENLEERFANTIMQWSGGETRKERENLTKDKKRLQQTAYVEGKTGWFACGYGPFRRLSGGEREAERILYAERKAARFLTLFKEEAALTNVTEWLIRLHNMARENDSKSAKALEQVKKVFAEKLFPEKVQLEITAKAAMLKIGEKEFFPLRDLSDGYRSMLSLMIDLVHWLIRAFPDAENPMECPGIVLIDELDAHLHPEWQRHIGYWLREKFPNLQFIIATHSGFLAQVSEGEDSEGDKERRETQHSGSNIKLEQTDEGVIIKTDFEPTENLRVDQIYQSDLFDMESVYSPLVEKKVARHEALHQAIHKNEISAKEREEYEQLSLWRERLLMLPNLEERQIEKTLRDAIKRHEKKLKEME